MSDDIVLRRIECDEAGALSDVTLTFPIETLAHLAQILGRRSGSEGSREEAIATSSFYNAVTGEVFNRYWDDGVDGYFNA